MLTRTKIIILLSLAVLLLEGIYVLMERREAHEQEVAETMRKSNENRLKQLEDANKAPHKPVEKFVGY